jgi:hypothetical protein
VKTSEQIDQIAAAMAKAQEMMKPAHKDALNPHYRSKYSDLAGCWEAWRPAGPPNGLAVVQDVLSGFENGGAVAVTTRLTHISGQWMEFGPLAVPLSKADAHGVGSATSYAKRYGFCAATGIVAADEDDDGNAATQGSSPSQPAPKREKRPEGPRITAKPEDIGNPERKSDVTPEQLDAELRQNFPAGIEGEEEDLRPKFLTGDLTCFCGKRVFTRKDGTGWFCWDKRGGCGRNWKAVPAVAGGATSVDRETGEVLAAPDPSVAAEERKALLLKAKKLADAIGLSDRERATAYSTYVGDVRPDQADVSALADMVKWLATRAEAVKK